MIKIIAKFTVKPECVDTFLSVTEGLIKCSQAEDGNITYTLNKNINADNEFVMIEGWKDQAAIDTHNNSEHFTSAIPKLTPLLAAPLDVNLYTEV